MQIENEGKAGRYEGRYDEATQRLDSHEIRRCA